MNSSTNEKCTDNSYDQLSTEADSSDGSEECFPYLSYYGKYKT